MAKNSDWNQSAINRKDFRHGKTDVPERVKVPNKKKKKKKIVVQFKYTGNVDSGFCFFKEWATWGKYAKIEDALKAIENQRKKPFWGDDFEFRLKGKKGNV